MQKCRRRHQRVNRMFQIYHWDASFIYENTLDTDIWYSCANFHTSVVSVTYFIWDETGTIGTLKTFICFHMLMKASKAGFCLITFLSFVCLSQCLWQAKDLQCIYDFAVGFESKRYFMLIALTLISWEIGSRLGMWYRSGDICRWERDRKSVSRISELRSKESFTSLISDSPGLKMEK